MGDSWADLALVRGFNNHHHQLQSSQCSEGTLLDVSRQLTMPRNGGESLWSSGAMEWPQNMNIGGSKQHVRNSGVVLPTSFFGEPTSVLDMSGAGPRMMQTSGSMKQQQQYHHHHQQQQQMREFQHYPSAHQNMDPNVEIAKRRAMVSSGVERFRDSGIFGGGMNLEWELEQRRIEQGLSSWRNVDAKPPQQGGVLDCAAPTMRDLELQQQNNRRMNPNNNNNGYHASRVLEEVCELANVSPIGFQLQDFHPQPVFGYGGMPPFQERVASNDGTSNSMDCLISELQGDVGGGQGPDAMSPSPSCFKSNNNYSPPTFGSFDMLQHRVSPPESTSRFTWQPDFVMCDDDSYPVRGDDNLGCNNVSSPLSSGGNFLLPPAPEIPVVSEPSHLQPPVDLRTSEPVPNYPVPQLMHSLETAVPSTTNPGDPFLDKKRTDDLSAAAGTVGGAQDLRREISVGDEPTQSRPRLIEGAAPESSVNETQRLQLKNLELRNLLSKCAVAVETRNDSAQVWLKNLDEFASPDGDVAQRVASCFSAAFSQRLGGGGGDRKSVTSEPQAWREDLLENCCLVEACPYSQFVHLTANQALVEAVEGADVLHIIDFGIVQGVQWSLLLQALAMEPGRKPPRIRITGIASPKLGPNPSASLIATGRRLSEFAESLGLELQFCPLVTEMKDLDPKILQVADGECVAIHFMLQLHQYIGGDPSDPLLRNVLELVRDLQPKVVVLVEYEAAVSNADFQTRLLDGLEHYLAIFESLDSLPRDSSERKKIERLILGEEILALFGHDDNTDGRVRFEPFARWCNLMESSAFKVNPPSHFSNSQARLLLWKYSSKFILLPSTSSLSLGWQDRRLITVSAWKCC